MYSRFLDDVTRYGGMMRNAFHIAFFLDVQLYHDRDIERLRDVHRHTDNGFGVDEIKDLYRDRHMADGRLWRYALENICSLIAQDNIDEEWSEAWAVYCKKHPGVALEVVEMQVPRRVANMAMSGLEDDMMEVELDESQKKVKEKKRKGEGAREKHNRRGRNGKERMEVSAVVKQK
jgi:DNA-binding transcriptional MerR regulator